MVRSNILFAQFPRTEASAAAHLLRLSEREGDSARLAGTLRSALDLAVTALEPPLRETVSEYEKQLVRLAEKATIHEQNVYFDSVQLLKRGGSAVAPRFFAWLENALARLGRDGSEGSGPERSRPKLTLSLSDGAQLDESTVLSDIASKVEGRIREPLYALGQRFAVLAGSPRIASDALPLGPACITAALRYAAAELDVPLSHRLVLYRCFERVALVPIGAFYAALNQHLADLGILRSLHTLQGREGMARPAMARSERPARAEPAAAPTAAPPAAPTTTPDKTDFAKLRQMLGACRRAECYAVSTAELQNVLAAMQSRRAACASGGEALAVLAAETIRAEIFAVLSERGAAGRVAQLDGEDSDTIDLLAMWFESLARQVRDGGIARWALALLQIPMLRLALREKAFFAQPGHAARRLLADLIELGRVWVDDADGEREPALVDELRRIAQAVAYEYHDDASVFVRTSDELAEHTRRLAQRVALAERRQIDAAIGYEKLARARAVATAAIAERMRGGAPNDFVGMLLQRGWTDVLIMTLLREGEHSDAYARRLRVAEALIAGAAVDSGTCDELAGGLAQIGLHDEDVRAICAALCGSACDEDPISLTELAIKLKLKPRLGADAGGGSCAEHESPPLGAAEQRAFDRLHTVPHGSWFEFASGDQWEPRKLAWYSTHTGRCLFLDARGTAAENLSLRDLARACAAGTARRGPADGTLADRVWQSILEMLQRFCASEPVRAVDTAPSSVAPLACSDVNNGDATAPVRTLLLVDDEVNVQRALMRVLRHDHYRILTATSAAEALDLLREHEVQVIVSDQRMPGLTGTEFLSQVKITHPRTVRLLLSGFSDAAAVTEAINRGAIYKFLTKPWDDADFRTQVSEAFRAFEQR